MRLISFYNTQRKALQLPERISLRFLKFKKPKWQQLKLRIIKEKKLQYRIVKILKKIRVKNNRKRPFFKKIKIYYVKLHKKKNLNKKKYKVKWIKRRVLKFSVLKTSNFKKVFTLKNKYIKRFKLLKSSDKIQKFKSKRVNNLFIFCKKLERIKKYYKECLGSKHSYNCFYNSAIRRNQALKLFDFNKKKEFKLSFLKCIIKPILRLDILLWYFNFFNSVFQVKEFIRKKLIKVNNKFIRYNFFLKKGDIITFSNKINVNTFCVRKNIKNFSKNSVLFNFFEIDFYTNTIVVIKDLSFLSEKDITLLMSFYYDIKKMKFYLLR